MLRTCTKCGETKDEADFYSTTQRGITRLRAVCKMCSRTYAWDRSDDPKPSGRVCTVCKQYKPLTDFHRHKICLYGIEPFCKKCKLDKRKVRERNNPRQARNVDLKAKYGITIEDYEAMFARQSGQCAICGREDQKLVVDHHHATGRVRSLLCHLCNAMIGCAREQPEILRRGAAYLATFVAS